MDDDEAMPWGLKTATNPWGALLLLQVQIDKGLDSESGDHVVDILASSCSSKIHTEDLLSRGVQQGSTTVARRDGCSGLNTEIVAHDLVASYIAFRNLQ